MYPQDPDRITHLYAHVPFCPQKCSYCAFVTHVGSLKLLPLYLEALAADAVSVAGQRPAYPLETVYLGGGTPSVMSPEQLENFLRCLASIFGLEPESEITIEAHPSTVDAEKLRLFARAGVTRISVGGESLQSGELHGIGRTHAPERVLEVVHAAREAGFQSVALDLMYGLPGQTRISWHKTLELALASGAEHLSLYPLSVEPGTVFSRRAREGGLHLASDDTVVEMYHLACDLLHENGFIHYEVANWALPGHQCRHNLAYWTNRQFYGVGVGAHDYIKPRRSERMRQTKRYIDLVLGGGDPVVHAETLGPAEERTEALILGLRLLDQGLDWTEFQHRFDTDLPGLRSNEVASLMEQGLIHVEGNRLLLAERAVPVANEVWQRLM